VWKAALWAGPWIGMASMAVMVGGLIWWCRWVMVKQRNEQHDMTATNGREPGP
jgi:hypothetical protein